MATIEGTPGADTLNGTALADRINTRDGQDTVDAGAGDDEVNGSILSGGQRSFQVVSGAKTVNGRAGRDTIFGGSGADRLYGDEDDDFLFGLEGQDLLEGGLGQDSLEGGEGNDTLRGGAGNDTLDGGNGADLLSGDEGDDQLFHQRAGAATLLGGGGNDALNAYTGTGSKTLDGGDGDDRLDDGTGDDLLIGGAGADSLFGSEGQDTLQGGDGDDRLFDQTASADTLEGGAGNDLVSGFSGSGAKRLEGGDGADTLQAGTGADQLFGGAGADYLAGNEGADTLWGGSGDDTLVGGAGHDVFVLDDRLDLIIDGSTQDIVRIEADWIKVPAALTQRQYADGVQALPYWIDALTASNANWYSSLVLGTRTMFFTFPATLPGYNDSAEDANGYTPFTDIQKARARDALSYVASVVDLQFLETQEPAARNTLAFASNIQTGSAAYASFPSADAKGSDIFLQIGKDNQTLADGTYGALTLIHEIAHALGLKHPFADADATEPDGPYLTGVEESTVWTTMSYNSSEQQYRLELQALDIAALHYLYGPSPRARTGQDTYTVSATAPNFIWDGAGIDTLDASGLSQGATIYLSPGWWGHVGSTRGSRITEAGQITVNFGTTIENLVGTGFADRLTGNEAGNRISAGAGADTLEGGGGNDELIGGDGLDVAVYGGARSAYSVQRESSGTLVVSGPAGEVDRLTEVERLRFGGSSGTTMLGFDVDGIGGKTYRLYKAAYDRAPDPAGLGFWMHFLDNGFDMLTAANNFLNSEEFRKLYDEDANAPGYQEPSIERFVSKVYRFALQREPEGAGYQFWVDAMYNKDGAFGKAYSRGEVLIAFAESAENKANVVGSILNGFEYTPFTG